jgi:hypothetical protein
MPSEFTQGSTISLAHRDLNVFAESLRRPSGGTLGLPDALQLMTDYGGTTSLLGPARILARHTAPIRAPRGPSLTAATLAERLATNPYEAGEPHPLVPELTAGLAEHTAAQVREVVALFERRPDLRADLLRCLGRLPADAAASGLLSLLTHALALPSLRVRGAAVRALEDWGSAAAWEVLRRHEEPDARLADYVRRVLR